MIIILSPSKTMVDKAPLMKTVSNPRFFKQAEILMQHLKQLSKTELADKMHLSPKLLEQTYHQFQSWNQCSGTAQPALLTYKGEAFKSLLAETFSDEDLLFANQHLRIMSGLYGLLKPNDLIMKYRLEMKYPLKTNGHNNLYQFWSKQITKSLEETLSILNVETPFLLNLASTEYSKAIIQKELKFPIFTPIFKQSKNGSLRTISAFAKQARGAMARYIVRKKYSLPEQIKTFAEDGYQYSELHSSTNEWFFIRK